MSSQSTLSANNSKPFDPPQLSKEDLDNSVFSQNSSNLSSFYAGDELSSSDSMMIEGIDDIERHDSIFMESEGEENDEASCMSTGPTIDEISAINIGRKFHRLEVDNIDNMTTKDSQKISKERKGDDTLSITASESEKKNENEYENEKEKETNTYATKRNSLTYLATTTRKSLTGNLNLSNFAITNRYSTGMRFFDTSTVTKEQTQLVHDFPTKLNSEMLTVIEMAVNLFNLKPHRGVDHLIKNNIILPSPEGVVWFLKIRKDDLSKRKLGEFLSGPDPDLNILHKQNESIGSNNLNDDVSTPRIDSKMIPKSSIRTLLFEEYDFSEVEVDESLRALIQDIRLPGEAQQIYRMIESFAHRYFQCNTDGIIQDEDTVLTLAFSLIMLNTDLHNRNLTKDKKMSLNEFIKNLDGIDDGNSLPRELLTKYYTSIKNNELRMKESDLYETEFLTFMAPRMSGWLCKQNTTSSHTAFLQKFSSRIGWNRHWFVLAGGCLYYFKQPQDVQVGTFRCMIPLDGITPVKDFKESTIIHLFPSNSSVVKSGKILKKNGFSLLPKQDKGIIQSGSHKSFTLKAESSESRDEWLEMLQKESSLSPMAVVFRRRRLSTEIFNYTKELLPVTPNSETLSDSNKNVLNEREANTLSTSSNSNSSDITFKNSPNLTEGNKATYIVPVVVNETEKKQGDSNYDFPEKEKTDKNNQNAFTFNLDETASTVLSTSTVTNNKLTGKTPTGVGANDNTPNLLYKGHIREKPSLTVDTGALAMPKLQASSPSVLSLNICNYEFQGLPIAEGWLRRKSDKNYVWQRRYFVLIRYRKVRKENDRKERQKEDEFEWNNGKDKFSTTDIETMVKLEKLDQLREEKEGISTFETTVNKLVQGENTNKNEVTIDSQKESSSNTRLGLFFFVTKVMATNMFEQGISTEQGLIHVRNIRKIKRNKETLGLELQYEKPLSSPRVVNDYEVSTSKSDKETLMADNEAALSYWYKALNPYIQVFYKVKHGINIDTYSKELAKKGVLTKNQLQNYVAQSPTVVSESITWTNTCEEKEIQGDH